MDDSQVCISISLPLLISSYSQLPLGNLYVDILFFCVCGGGFGKLNSEFKWESPHTHRHGLMYVNICEHLVSSWWRSLGRFMKCGIAGEQVARGTLWEFNEFHHFKLLSLFHACSSRWEPRASALATTPPACCHASHHDRSDPLEPQTQINLLWVALVMFHHIERKVTSTHSLGLHWTIEHFTIPALHPAFLK